MQRNYVRRYQTDELYSYYMERTVHMHEKTPDTTKYNLRSMHDATILMASEAELASTTPLEELSMHTPLMFFLIHNVEELGPKGNTSYLEALNRTTFLLTMESSKNIGQLKLLIAGTAGGVVALFIVLLLALLLPMVN
jgi:hypothetical protein